MRPDQVRPRTLTEAEPLPADLVGRLADQAIYQYEQLARDGRPAGDAPWPPLEKPAAVDRAARAVAGEFEAARASRDWNVPQDRVRQLAVDAIGLYVEGYAYGYDREQARAAAVLECLQGEAAPAELSPLDLAVLALAERVRGGGER
jgi:hypothetical protein